MTIFPTTSFWSVKGGVGVSTVAAMFAIARSERAEPSILIDLDGDQPALLGLPEPTGAGVSDWCATPGRSPDALSRISTTVSVDLALVHRGRSCWPHDAEPLIDAVRALGTHVFIDAGRAHHPFVADVAARCDHRLLVLRSCYLALRAAQRLAATPRVADDPTPVEFTPVNARPVHPAPGSVAPRVAPTGIVLVHERGRSLGAGDAEAVVGVPVVAEIVVDAAIARCIDAGLITTRLPRSLLRTLNRSHVPA